MQFGVYVLQQHMSDDAAGITLNTFQGTYPRISFTDCILSFFVACSVQYSYLKPG